MGASENQRPAGLSPENETKSKWLLLYIWILCWSLLNFLTKLYFCSRNQMQILVMSARARADLPQLREECLWTRGRTWRDSARPLELSARWGNIKPHAARAWPLQSVSHSLSPDGLCHVWIHWLYCVCVGMRRSSPAVSLCQALRLSLQNLWRNSTRIPWSTSSFVLRAR